MSLEAILITYSIKSHEVRDVAKIDIPVEYLHKESNEVAIMRLKLRLTKLLVSINPKLYRR